MAICISEDRLSFEPALRLLISSLGQNADGWPIHVFFPAAGTEFAAWIGGRRNCTLRRMMPAGGGWNVKPSAILRLLSEGFNSVLWLDSDILVNRPLSALLSSLDKDTLVVAEGSLGRDRWDGDAVRTRLWGLDVGRTFPFVLNTGVLRVSKSHQGLVERWQELISTEPYQEAQITPWLERPIHMLGDQDVLTALLGCAEYARIPVKILRRGRDIIQFAGPRGYSMAERARGLFGGGPIFVHAIYGAGKPWCEDWSSPRAGIRERFRRIYLDVSPYTLYALPFRNEIGVDAPWMDPHSPMSKALRFIAADSPALAGLVPAVAADLAWVASALRRRRRRRRPGPGLLATRGRGWAE